MSRDALDLPTLRAIRDAAHLNEAITTAERDNGS